MKNFAIIEILILGQNDEAFLSAERNIFGQAGGQPK